MIDYRETLRWLSRGNSRTHANSWIGYCRLSRTRITGYKKKKLGHPSEKLSTDVPRANWRVIIFSELVAPVAMAVMFVIAYLFVKSFSTPPVNGLLRIMVIAIGPVAFNLVILVVIFFVALLLGPALNSCCPRFATINAAIAHTFAVIGLIGAFQFLWFLERWNISNAVIGMIAVMSIQRALFKFLIALFLSREFKHDQTNKSFWSGKCKFFNSIL